MGLDTKLVSCVFNIAWFSEKQMWKTSLLSENEWNWNWTPSAVQLSFVSIWQHRSQRRNGFRRRVRNLIIKRMEILVSNWGGGLLAVPVPWSAFNAQNAPHDSEGLHSGPQSYGLLQWFRSSPRRRNIGSRKGQWPLFLFPYVAKFSQVSRKKKCFSSNGIFT